MSKIRFNKFTPRAVEVNKIKIWYDTTDSKLKVGDENGVNVAIAGFSPKDYRLIKVSHILQGTTTYTPSADCKALYVECIGAGGAGGGAGAASNLSLGSGGGAGAYSAVWLTGAAVKTSFACVVGAGGVSANAATGGTGDDTTFDSPSVCTAKGGLGGTVLAAGTSLVTQNGGVGGTAASGVGDDKFDGSDGNWGIRLSGSVGLQGSGGPGPLGIGHGNATKFGGGGNGNLTTNNLVNGSNGANGLIRVTEYA